MEKHFGEEKSNQISDNILTPFLKIDIWESEMKEQQGDAMLLWSQLLGNPLKWQPDVSTVKKS